MTLGMSLSTFTAVHVLMSLIGIASGLVALYGWLVSKRLNGVNTIFLVTTALTSITGFGFPFDHLLPSHKLGIISLVLLALAIPARYVFHTAGAWRWIYLVTAGLALWANVFVLIAQSFMKVPAIHALAPTQSEPPFAVAQLTVLVIFLALFILSGVRYHPERGHAA